MVVRRAGLSRLAFKILYPASCVRAKFVLSPHGKEAEKTAYSENDGPAGTDRSTKAGGEGG